VKTRFFLYTLAILSIMGFSLPAGAEFPDRPITMIVNWGAGGGADLGARALAAKAEKFLGQPIAVMNKTGASGTVGVGAVATAKPDGYTIGVITLGAITLVPHTIKVPYNPLRDFDYILGYGEYLFGPVVRTESPFKTLKDLVQYAKDNPGKIKFSHVGMSTPNHFGMVKLSKAEGGIKWDAVVFKGTVDAVTACLGGHVDVVSQGPGDVGPYITAGRMRLLASFSARRWEIAPDVPTVRELGYNFDVGSWLTLGAPKGIPKPIMDKLRSAFKKAIDDPSFLDIMKKINLPMAYLTPEQCQQTAESRYIEDEAMVLEIGAHKSQKK